MIRERMAGTESTRWIRRGLIGAVLIGGIAIAWSGRGDFTPADSGRVAPDYAAATLEGDTFDIAALRGSVVVLNIWATWCRPCVREMPALQRLWERNRDDGLVVVGISVDSPALLMGDAESAVRNFVDDLGLTFPIVVDPDRRIEEGYPVAGYPMTFVIDREGRIVDRVLGPREWDQPAMESELRILLES
jgi:peroxiredoxin